MVVAIGGAVARWQLSGTVIKAPSTTSITTKTLAATSPFPHESPPIRLTIPSLGIVAGVGSVAMTATGQLQAPPSTSRASWYRLGPTPGQVGASVIEGHVDSSVGPGVFIHLSRILPGAKVTVALANGETVLFRVVRIREYEKDSFPNRSVYTAPSSRWLNLVTCGGTFDRTSRHYRSIVVVFTTYAGMRD